ncbi:MAG: c-type cytochrome [Dongiaceae bacterium]
MNWKIIVSVLIIAVCGYLGYGLLQSRTTCACGPEIQLDASTTDTTATAATTTQTAALDPAAAVSKRQALMKELGGHMKAINEFVENGNGSAADVATRAEAIKTASTRIVDLFPEGTSIDDNIGKTAAKPEIWTRLDEFGTDATRLGEEAGKLAEAAAAGDKTRIGEQFAMLGKAAAAAIPLSGRSWTSWRFGSCGGAA